MSESSPSSHRHYTGEAGRRYQDGKRGIPAEAYDWIARLRAEKLQARIQASDVVYEFGVGTGWNLAGLQCARRLGSDVAGFLGDEVRRRGIEFVAGPGAVAEHSVDVIICHHVLEHVADPFGTLTALRSKLRHPGLLLLFVPFERERRFRRHDPAEPNHHLYSWNVQTLGNLVTDCGYGLQEARLRRFRFDRFAAVLAQRWHLGERGYRFLRGAGLVVSPEYEIAVVADGGTK